MIGINKTNMILIIIILINYIIIIFIYFKLNDTYLFIFTYFCIIGWIYIWSINTHFTKYFIEISIILCGKFFGSDDLLIVNNTIDSHSYYNIGIPIYNMIINIFITR